MTGREAALTVLERCRREEAWAGAVLDGLISDGKLSAREASLASQLSLGVLQNDCLLDFYIRSYYSGKLQPKLADILKIGAYQILFMDKIPDRAAVNEGVALSKKTGLAHASGLVNAVLRRFSENKDQLPSIPGEGTAAYLCIRFSHPLWLVQRLIDQRGYDFTEAFLPCNNKKSPLELQINTLRCEKADYLRALSRAEIPFETPAFPENCVSLPGGRVSELPGYEEGLFYVQDRAAAMAVEIALPLPGMQVLDTCAAPGGKSFAAAIRMKNKGLILSRDIHAKKLRRIESGAERLGLTCIKTGAGDARCDEPALHGAFDLVMTDVPCSGIGVIRKRPEIRNKPEAEIARLPEIQKEILSTASAYVKPGGTLLYSTCTVLREENEGVVEAFLSMHPKYKLQSFSVGGKDTCSGMYTFWPQIDGTDGFFAAKIKRIEE